jgi:hypothetical protein
MKCIVKDCQNEHGQGIFFGLLCSPCHAYITKGEGKHSQMYRNTVPEVTVVSADVGIVAAYESGFDAGEAHGLRRYHYKLMQMHTEAGGRHNYYHVAANYLGDML